MFAIERAHNMGWSKLWIESDSQTVVLAFSNKSAVPWTISNK